MKKYLFSTVLLCSLLQANETKDLSALSLEELMDVQVTSTSRRNESQHLAPGIVTVVSSQEMRQFGARHLRDVVDRLVGTQVLGSHQDPHSKTSMRAFNSSHHEGHVLILLNGRPVRQATDGGLNSDFYLGFPLSIIDHLEVVRGPGSVIYGSNAVTGIINIITKNGQESVQETKVDLAYGSFNRKQGEVSTLVGGTDYSLNVGLNYISADGDTVDDMVDSDSNIGRYKSGENSKNLVVSGEYKNFTFDAIYMDTLLDSASSAFQFPSKDIDLRRYYMDFGYLQEITSGWDISFHYTFQSDSADWQINEAAGYNRSEARSDLVETIVRGNISEDINLLVGATYAKNESGFDRGLPKGTIIYNTTAYTQADYMLSAKQKIIAGVQWNKPSNVESDLSYRAGFIQGYGENTWLKLLYSEAYRSPTMVETNLDAAQLKGNPNLDPEKVYTYDVQLINQTAQTYLALTLYHSKLENLVVRVPGAVTTHANEGYVTFNGVEAEGRYEVSKLLDIIGNISYQENETNNGVKQSTFAPNIMAKLGVTYKANEGYSLSAFNSYIGESTDLGEVTNDPTININHKADAYNLLTANIILDTGMMFGLGKVNTSFFSLYLDNLLDEEIYAPDLNFANANNTIPSHWGRSFFAKYTYKF